MSRSNVVLVFLCSLIALNCQSTKEFQTFEVNYGVVKPADVKNNQMVILEPENYTHLQVLSLRNTGAKIIGYVSLGEVNPDRWYFPLLKEHGFLGKNKNWDSYYINLKDTTSQNLILNKVIPNIIEKGFNGLFFDTVDDVAPYTSRSDLQPYMVHLIKEVRKRYPQITIIQNDGLFLLDRTHKYIDGVLVEDVATKYNFKNKTYNLASKKWYMDKVDSIEKYQDKYHIPFYIIDYAVSKKLIRKVKERLDTLNTPFFISNIDLN